MRFLTTVFLSMIFSFTAWAEPAFEDISEEDLEAITEDFSGMFGHTSVSPASSLGSVFGVEVGLTLGMVTADNIQEISEEQDPEADVDKLPFFGILAAVSIPLGVTFEVNLVPEVDQEDFEFDKTGIAVKWTLTEMLLDLPVDLSLRVHRTEANLAYSQTIDGATGEVAFTNTITGANVVVSKNFLFVEPYLGFGFVSAEGDLKETVSSGNSIFDAQFGGTSSESTDLSGNEFFIGAQLNLFVFRLGAEYGRMFEADRMIAKASLKF